MKLPRLVPILFVAITATIIGATGLAAQEARPVSQVSIFLAAEPSPAGIIESPTKDATEDIRRELPSRTKLRLASRPADADLMLFVSRRHRGDGTPIRLSARVVPWPGGAGPSWTNSPNPTTLMVPEDYYAVRARLYLGPLYVPPGDGSPGERAFIRFTNGVAEGSWRAAARAVTIDLEQWITANATALTDILSEPPRR